MGTKGTNGGHSYTIWVRDTCCKMTTLRTKMKREEENQNRDQWQTFVLATLNIWFLLKYEMCGLKKPPPKKNSTTTPQLSVSAIT